MSDLLTTRQLEDLLQVDRTTIYRMLGDGRLSGIKVGGQWRFSRAAIEAWLAEHRPQPEAAPEAAAPPVTAEVLPLVCIRPIQQVFAEILDVGSVTTDLTGKPLTEISNSCDFCNLILTTPEGQRRCQASWRLLASQTEHEPRTQRCHAGLGYARGRIDVDGQFIAMTFAGQFLVDGPDALFEARIPEVAVACSIDEGRLRDATSTVRQVDDAQVIRLTRLLQTVADAFCHIARERRNFLDRLTRIADLTAV